MDWFLYDNELRHEGVKVISVKDRGRIFFSANWSSTALEKNLPLK